MNKLLQKSASFVKRNSSTILTWAGGAGVVATSIMAVKATPKALELLEQAKEEKGEDLTTWEKVRYAGPVYIPSVIVGAGTIACIFGANILNKRHQAAIVSAYALLDGSFKEHKKKVAELYGEDANDRVREEILKDKFEEQDVSVTEGKRLFYDDFSGRIFESTLADVIAAEYAINRTISVNGGAYLNEWYEELDVAPVAYGEYIGWSSGLLMDTQWSSWLEFTHEMTTIDDDLEVCMITMSMEPMFDFEYY